MGQAIGESVFEVFYLIFAIVMGYRLLIKGKENNNKAIDLFGIATLILGFGDSFHLVPRMYALWTDGIANHPASLGFGKLVTSITMTIFYVLLFKGLEEYFDKKDEKTEKIIVVLAVIRILLCLLPQNQWLSADAPLSFGIIRNIPFTILGIVVILYVYKQASGKDKALNWMWLAICLSFAFYLPVVLFASKIPMMGMLMLPKTVMYIWIVLMLKKCAGI